MQAAILFAIGAVLLQGTLADITGTNPASGACLCLNTNGVNIRSSACGTVIGSGNSGNCFKYQGSKQTCTLNGVSYEFFKFAYGSGSGWAAGIYLNSASSSSCGSGSGGFTDKCMKCICQVESNCNPNIGCRWDVNSDSCGPYQIKEAYWIDCGRPGSDWRSCANNMQCAEGCVKAYMNRYGTYCTGGRTPVCQDYSRIHNGGPKGCTSSATVGYWDKVRACCGSASGCD